MTHRYLALPVAFVLHICISIGCGPNNAPSQPITNADHSHTHDHPEAGPHQGTLIELGNEEYHGEFVYDSTSHAVTIYLLDGSAKKSVSISATEIGMSIKTGGKPSNLTIPAVPESTDPKGHASRFVLYDESVGKTIISGKAVVRIVLEIQGKPYSGELIYSEK